MATSCNTSLGSSTTSGRMIDYLFESVDTVKSVDPPLSPVPLALKGLFLTLGASLIREEGDQVIDSKPIMFGRHGLQWSLLADLSERTLYPEAFNRLRVLGGVDLHQE